MIVMIELKLGQYTGKPNSLNKEFIPSLTLNILRFNTDDITSTVRMGNTDLDFRIYGYASVLKDNRLVYYFVDRIEWLGKRGTIIHLRKDILLTYQSEILASEIEVTGFNQETIPSLEHTNDNYIIIVGG